ncbi:hypothetical protein [uncultured Williamsia sp.]|uniref:hypothetical protein n=1 Tax=uncultured Williamsia sp. TaxID=259311 RepID=UPI0026174DBA|nr:hypothetical protein [uncultured Williamsia sp.]
MTTLRQNIGDRRFAGGRYTAAIGPVDVVGGAPGVRDRLLAIAGQGRHTRIGLIPHPTAARWDHDVTRAVAVREPDWGRVDDIGTMMELANDTATAPIDIALVDDHLFATVDHGIGDGVFVTELLPALTRVTAGPFPRHVVAGDTVTRHPSVRALASAIRRHPGSTARSMRSVVHGTAGAAGPQTSLAPDARRQTVVIGSEPGFADRLRRLRDDRFPGATAAATLSWTIDRHLRGAGLPLAPTLSMMVNLRRHLPAGTACTGNFVGAVTAPTTSPQEMTQAVQARLRSTDLVVHQALSDALGAVRPERMREPHHKRAVHDRTVRLVVSDLSGSPAIPTTRWNPDSVHPRTFGIATLCNRSDEIDLVYTRVDDRLFVTARFFDGYHDATTIGSAIREALLEPADAL